MNNKDFLFQQSTFHAIAFYKKGKFLEQKDILYKFILENKIVL